MAWNMKRILASLAILTVVGLAFGQRTPTVSYTATGLAGSWDLEFTLTNNFLSDEGSFYFLGVYLDTGRNIVATPSGWDADRFREWSNQSYGGSTTLYNNVWLNLYSRPDDILSGASKSGFIAHTTSIDPATSLPFFAFAAAGTYHGLSNYSNSWNPGFEGSASLSAIHLVPEPAGLAVLGLGLVGLRRKRRR